MKTTTTPSNFEELSFELNEAQSAFEAACHSYNDLSDASRSKRSR